MLTLHKFALLAALAASGVVVTMSAQAAPLGGGMASMSAAVSQGQSSITQVHYRIRSRCYWRHGHQHCGGRRTYGYSSYGYGYYAPIHLHFGHRHHGFGHHGFGSHGFGHGFGGHGFGHGFGHRGHHGHH